MFRGKSRTTQFVGLLTSVGYAAMIFIVSAAAADSLVYETGFEVPDFLPGHLDGQDGWLNPSKTVLVSPVDPAAGRQSMLILGSKLNPVSTPELIGTRPGRLFFFDASGQKIGVGVDVKLDGPVTPRQDLVSGNLILLLADDEVQPVNLGEAWLSSAGFVLIADSSSEIVGSVRINHMETYHRLGAVIDFQSKSVRWYVDGEFQVEIPDQVTHNVFAVANPGMYAFEDRKIVKATKYRAYFDNYCVMSGDYAESCAIAP